MDSILKEFNNLLLVTNKNLQYYIKICSVVGATEEKDFFQKTIIFFKKLEEDLKDRTLKKNYLIILRNEVLQINKQLSYKNHGEDFLSGLEQIQKRSPEKNLLHKTSMQKASSNILPFKQKLDFILDFFKQLNFFESNIVAIGANGSGKTSLANHIRNDMRGTVLVISAQRVLKVPIFSFIQNPDQTFNKLKGIQSVDKSAKNESSFNTIASEFSVVIENILAEDISYSYQYRKTAKEFANNKNRINPPKTTNLEKTFEIWNSLISHREIFCKDGINILAKERKSEYPIMQMSDGEKVMLFLIAQVLQAPSDGFIIVDEPEMYLHKSIVKKLWNLLETERDDCIFIYLTHDLDFASSRKYAKKVWIKSYTPPASWTIEDLPNNELPETMLMELLGSRNNILFCEGTKNSNDEIIYNNLFPNFTVSAVESCQSVINYTKAFNKLKNTHSKAYGIIDSDFRENKELESLKQEGIYNIKVAEIENLFLVEDFLTLFCKYIDEKNEIISNIKNVIIDQLQKDIELQISNFISSKINHYFSNSHMKKGNIIKDVKNNFDTFLNNIEIDDWYSDRKSMLEQLIEEKNYTEIIKRYNNKGLKKFGNEHFKITNFQERAIKFLNKNEKAKLSILKNFPSELISLHDKSNINK